MYNGKHNKTVINEFLLAGLTNFSTVRYYLFALILIVYIVTITANIFIIAIVKSEPCLHKPMYFFIGGLSFLEIWYPSVTVPRLLKSLLTKQISISSAGCVTQLYFHFSFGVTENFLLVIMAFDRYMAICNPLRYTLIMTPHTCIHLILGSWIVGFLALSVICVQISNLSFCSKNIIDHYYCDFEPLVKLSCSDTSHVQRLFFSLACLIIFGCFVLISLSYICIIQTTMTISSSFWKTFSTCASHLIVVILFYGTTIFMFIRPTSGGFLHLNKIVSVIPSIVTPLLNPIIYTLRNVVVKDVVKKIFQKIVYWRNWT